MPPDGIDFTVPAYSIADKTERDEAVRRLVEQRLNDEEFVALAYAIDEWDETVRQFRRPARNDNDVPQASS
jgi:hypothetical protein